MRMNDTLRTLGVSATTETFGKTVFFNNFYYFSPIFSFIICLSNGQRRIFKKKFLSVFIFNIRVALNMLPFYLDLESLWGT